MIDLLEKMLLGAIVSTVVIVISAVLYFWLLVFLTSLNLFVTFSVVSAANWVILGVLVLGVLWLIGYLFYRMHGLY